MHTLEKYLLALNNGDAREVADLFAPQCLFNDGGGRLIGLEDIVLKSRDVLFIFLSALFACSKVEAKLVKLNDHSMEYDVHSFNSVLPCISAFSTDENGLITEYIVRPR
jgi:hypothetical protein